MSQYAEKKLFKQPNWRGASYGERRSARVTCVTGRDLGMYCVYYFDSAVMVAGLAGCRIAPFPAAD